MRNNRRAREQGRALPGLLIQAGLFLAVFVTVLAMRWPRQSPKEVAAASVAQVPVAAQPSPVSVAGPQSGSWLAAAPPSASRPEEAQMAIPEEVRPEMAEPPAVPLDELTGEPIVAELIRH